MEGLILLQGLTKPMLQALPDLIPFKDHTIWLHDPASFSATKQVSPGKRSHCGSAIAQSE